MADMIETVQVFTTTETESDAQKIADALVDAKLAACVQVIGPISSTYRWKGKVETAEEWLCIIKTRASLYEELEAAVLELHPYEVPEILAVPVVAGSEDYLHWLEGSVTS